MRADPFTTAIARHVWQTRYRHRSDRDLPGTWRRVARALASVEAAPETWEPRFLAALEDFRFLPGGRILAGAGTDYDVTLFNCFVMGHVPDTLDGIFDALKEGARTMQQGGGVGYDFSTLRPKGTPTSRTGGAASGPVSFMHIWDRMCATVLSTGARRGAMMATLRCDHPDILEFVTAKQEKGALRHFNVSVQVTDDLLRAVREDKEWALVFPESGFDRGSADADSVTREIAFRRWTGTPGPVPCRVVGRIPARRLWDRILRATYDHAEPGVLFVDQVNAWNNLWYRERISATNPCGEIPLQPWGACDLGSLNLVAFVREPFAPSAHLDLEALASLAAVAVRMLDNVVDLSRFPLEAQAEQARGTRRLGLGITGLADALAMLGLPYGSEEGRALAARAMRTIRDAAWRASVDLAREKGPFPFFRKEEYLRGKYVRSLPEEVQDDIERHGVRNSHLLAIAPAGTISLLANNVSSGIEPVFDFAYSRHVLARDGSSEAFELVDHAAALFWERFGRQTPLPDAFVTATRLAPEEHLRMQAALQPLVDSSISKTITVPRDEDFERFKSVYERAWELGLKGVTTFRPNPVTGAVLESPDCCTI